MLLCDTDAFTTGVFHRHYLDEEPPPELVALQRRNPLYVLTDPETPFEQDPTTGLREERWRLEMHDAHEARLTEEGARVVRVKGSPAERTEQAAAAVRELLAERIFIRV